VRTFLRVLALAAAIAAGAPAGAGDRTLVGRSAPPFSLSTVDGGKTLSLADLKGQVVALDFWASWCAPCKRSLPHLAGLPASYRGLQVVGVSVDDDRNDAAEFLRRNRIRIIALHDADKKVAERYDVSGMPSMLLIDRKGTVRFVHAGYTADDMEEIEAQIQALLREQS
jgi:cytochrome c biogenesis protein CcmG/thiol:disulfide interchange protein DsbE